MDLTAADELEIIKKVLDGNVNAFEELISDNQKKVYNLALKTLGNEEDALDISQEAFLKAYTNLKSFRMDSKFSVWLYRLTYNLCIDLLRKKKRAQVLSLTYGDGDGDEPEFQIPDGRYSPEDEFEKNELRETVLKGLEELPPDHRQILVMREITGMSYAEISETLVLSEGTVKSRISRARLKLANILVNNGTFPDGYRQKGRKGVNPHD